jgi:glycosyltransferase involved in cell wall biosynthesis
VVLQVGTGWNKNVARVSAALDGLPVHLHVVGVLSRAEREALERHDLEWSNSTHLSDADLFDAYIRADLVVFASTYEGFGLPAVEAQTVGRPLVTSRTTSLPEIAGPGACYVDPGDVASIREGICRVLDDAALRDRLVEAGRENVQRFDPVVLAAQFADIYDELDAASRR